MLAFIEITLNFFTFTAIIAVSVLTGFILKKVKFSSVKKLVEKLEKEMLDNHAEILRLQKELSDKEINQSQTPIFSIRDTAAEVSKDNLPDSGLRKKMLSQVGKTKP
jgi:hypothetical protein